MNIDSDNLADAFIDGFTDISTHEIFNVCASMLIFICGGLIMSVVCDRRIADTGFIRVEIVSDFDREMIFLAAR